MIRSVVCLALENSIGEFYRLMRSLFYAMISFKALASDNGIFQVAGGLDSSFSGLLFGPLPHNTALVDSDASRSGQEGSRDAACAATGKYIPFLH